jgi:hypothetical protein
MYNLRRATLLLIVVGLCLFCLSSYGQPAYNDARTGIRVFFATESDMFPRKWYSGKIRAKAVSLDSTQYNRIREILREAMKKYPDTILSGNLEKVYALNSLEFYGIPYGGTSSTCKKTVFITDNSEFRENDGFIESIFHHEFSSLLFRIYRKNFSRREWDRNNPHGFSYGNGGREAIREGKSSMVLDSAMNREGFLNEYSRSSREEDFNVFAQNLFNGGKLFWEAVDKYPVIRQKANLVIAFYHRLDPVFTEGYFRGISDRGTE